MKYLVVTDIHGNMDAIDNIRKIIDKKHIDKIILLGDLFHPGVIGIANQFVVDALNNMSGITFAIRGNCDTEYDMKMVNFTMERKLVLKIHDKLFMFAHGDLHNPYDIPSDISYYIHGHTHEFSITKKDDLTIINLASISYPRGNSTRSYMIIDENIEVYDIEDNLIERIELKEV